MNDSEQLAEYRRLAGLPVLTEAPASQTLNGILGQALADEARSMFREVSVVRGYVLGTGLKNAYSGKGVNATRFPDFEGGIGIGITDSPFSELRVSLSAGPGQFESWTVEKDVGKVLGMSPAAVWAAALRVAAPHMRSSK